MSTVRVLVGTKKGAFILTSDGRRKNWEVNGPLFGGWEIYHLKGSPLDPRRLFASQTSGWFGQIIQRSDDGINWSDYDAQDCDKFYRDSSGYAGFYRIAIGDEDGNAVPPYSNAVYSDGL